MSVLTLHYRLLNHGAGDWPRIAIEAASRIAELEAALRDCIPFLAVNMDKYRRDYDLLELHPTHAEILDRVSKLSGGEPLACKLAKQD